MNEKLNIQDLVDILAEKHGMSKKNADSFVKEFFQLIEEALEKDKYVKVRGLGTFKLIDVESRESVNVNTRERFEIQGHTKVSFTPEPILKEIVNKPFSHFETVVLNDNTVLEDTPLDSENEDGEEVVDASELAVDNTIETTEALSEETEESSSEVILEKEIVENPEKSELVVALEEEPAEEKETPIVPQEVPAQEEEAFIVSQEETAEVTPIFKVEEEQPKPVKDAQEASSIKYFIGIVVFVVIACVGTIIHIYNPSIFDWITSEPPTEKAINAKTTDKVGLTDSITAKDSILPVSLDTVTKTPAVSLQSENSSRETPKDALQGKPAPNPVATKEQKKTTAPPFNPDSVGYTIVGTETIYTLQEGETLTKVALRFYGTKTLWPYIVKHNSDVIKNPDNVPFGTTIKIPKLVKKQ